MEGTRGFVTWNDVTSDIVEGQKATFYYMPSQLAQGWAGNAERVEVKSFRAGRVSSNRDKNAKVYVEFVPRNARKSRAAVQRSTPSLVILEGWQLPDPPQGWISAGTGVNKAKWPVFSREWREEMDAFLSGYLNEHPNIRVLADFRKDSKSQPNPQPAPTVGQEDVSITANTVNQPDPTADAGIFSFADDMELGRTLVEGAAKSVLVNAYERNEEARRRCIEHYGSKCSVCDFDFIKFYGSALRGYIHVHHLTPISEIGSDYVVDPIADLRPVCPNCHGVIHSRQPLYTIDEVRALIAAARLRQ